MSNDLSQLAQEAANIGLLLDSADLEAVAATIAQIRQDLHARALQTETPEIALPDYLIESKK